MVPKPEPVRSIVQRKNWKVINEENYDQIIIFYLGNVSLWIWIKKVSFLPEQLSKVNLRLSFNIRM